MVNILNSSSFSSPYFVNETQLLPRRDSAALKVIDDVLKTFQCTKSDNQMLKPKNINIYFNENIPNKAYHQIRRDLAKKFPFETSSRMCTRIMVDIFL